jgi:hypothetical protein
MTRLQRANLARHYCYHGGVEHAHTHVHDWEAPLKIKATDAAKDAKY